MARPASQHPTNAELEILRVLWESGPCSLGEICSPLRQERSVATTTVATVLKVMLEKNLVKRKQSQRGYIWSAQSGRSATATRMVRSLLDRVFDGSAHLLVTHLLESGDLTDDEREEVRRMLSADAE